MGCCLDKIRTGGGVGRVVFWACLVVCLYVCPFVCLSRCLGLSFSTADGCLLPWILRYCCSPPPRTVVGIQVISRPSPAPIPFTKELPSRWALPRYPIPRRSHYRITVFFFLFFRCIQTFLFPSAADDGLDSRLSPSANSTWRRLNNRPSSLDPAKSFPAQVRPLEAPNHPDGKPNPNHSFARLPGRSRSFIHPLAQLNQSVSPLTADNRFFPRIRQGFPSI